MAQPLIYINHKPMEILVSGQQCDGIPVLIVKAADYEPRPDDVRMAAEAAGAKHRMLDIRPALRQLYHQVIRRRRNNAQLREARVRPGCGNEVSR